MPKPAAFETCFASGLDLSEFSAQKSDAPSSSAAAASSSSSHAAELLKETQRKAEQRMVNERQELELAEAIQGHVLASTTTSSSAKPRKEAHAALLHMHTIEQKDEPRQRFIKKGPKTLQKKNGKQRTARGRACRR
eukprot:scaffold5869_cov165-Amphora_coffeaeformis.AAC.9